MSSDGEKDRLLDVGKINCDSNTTSWPVEVMFVTEEAMVVRATL